MILEKLPTWVEIDLNAISHNLKEVRRIIRPGVKIMAVVKANAYGHGAVQVANTALQNGADYLGVARGNEAIELREAGISCPIMVLGYSPVDFTRHLIEYDLIQSVFTYDMAKEISSEATSMNQSVKVHLKLDTGMGRIGLVVDSKKGTQYQDAYLSEKTLNEAIGIASFPGLRLEGIFTHFATADSKNKDSANEQLGTFNDILEKIKNHGVEIPLIHAANSAAVIDLPDAHYDMVRPGIMMYGLYPSDEVNHTDVILKPAMTLKARVVQVKKVPPGFKVSYGSTYVTTEKTKIATISIGYADGYNRILSSAGSMLVRGERAPVIGRVCMDQTMLDVGHIQNVAPGDEVVVFGKQGDSELHVDEIALNTNTINYEIVSSIMPRVFRLYC